MLSFTITNWELLTAILRVLLLLSAISSFTIRQYPRNLHLRGVSLDILKKSSILRVRSMRSLNPYQQATYEGFLQKLGRGMDRTQLEGVKRALNGRDLEPILAVLSSINHLAPEADAERAQHVKHLYYNLGLRGILKPIVPDNEARRKLLNDIAGGEVVHPRPRRESD